MKVKTFESKNYKSFQISNYATIILSCMLHNTSLQVPKTQAISRLNDKSFQPSYAMPILAILHFL